MHKAFKRIVENAETAVLFIHGIVGTPNHFRTLLPLVPENMSVYNLLLDGHGKGVSDFSRTSMKKWEEQVADAVEELAQTHRRIYVVGHSMGCLLALEQGMDDPNVSKLFLLNAPLKVFVRPKMLQNVVRMYFGYEDPQDEQWQAVRQCYGIQMDKNLFHYIGWIPRYLELFRKIRKVRREICRLQKPCVAYQSAKDEMVAVSAADVLRRNPGISVNMLSDSGHFYYGKDDAARLEQGFLSFIKE